MAKFTARIGLHFPTSNSVKESATYARLHAAMANEGFTHNPPPTGTYINQSGPPWTAAQMADYLKSLVNKIHTPNSGVVEVGDIAKW